MADFSLMSLAELKEEAKKRGLKGISAMRKTELVELLSAQEQPAEPIKAEEPKTAPKVMTAVTAEAKTEPAEENKAQGEKNSSQNTGDVVRRPMQYQERGQAGYAPQRRQGGNTSYVQQSKPSYNAQQGGYTARPQNQSQGQSQSSQPRPQAEVQSEQPQAPKGPSPQDFANMTMKELESYDSGETKTGILEIMPEGFGFIRCDNYLPGENDVYVSTPLLRKYGLRTGDIVSGNTKIRTATEKFSPLLYVKSINGYAVTETPMRRPKFEHLTPIFPNERIHLETPGCPLAMRMVDLISPIGKGQRGMIVSQPKTGKTTLLKQVAKAITRNHKDMYLIILLIDERPEEVTDIKESIEGEKVEVIYSTFDELPENHKRVSEMVIERAKRLVEHKKDVVILLDSITRLARAYNLTVQASGRTLSGGLDPAALHMPKKFFGAARNMREGGSLTVLATALVDTGSRMDDVVFEEFKGTGNMELVLNRNLSERRVFPAIDLPKSGTRREDLLLTANEMEASTIMRRALNGVKSEEATENIIKLFTQTRNNADFIEMVKRTKIIN